MAAELQFKPLNVGRWFVWGAFALVLLLAPLLMKSSFSLTLLSLMGVTAIACLSYNMLLGQTGLLSFGHAVYTGMGSFLAIHAMNRIAAGWPIPMSLVPLVGGLAGLTFGALFGYVTTKKAGTTFAMITLGIGELVFASALMFPEFFGGEGGINADRTSGIKVLGITYGPQIQVYYLIAVWMFVCAAAMYAFTQTPLGRIANAVRDNPERAEFIGYDARRVRYIVMMVSCFFAGIAGGLQAINFEAVTAESVSGIRSGGYLLFTFLGGSLFFFGPILGAVLLVFALVVLSEWTKAWQLYVGVVFLLMVIYAPGGLSSLIMMNLRVAKYGKLRPLLASYLALGGTLLGVLVALSAVIEMTYEAQLGLGGEGLSSIMGVPLSIKSADTWGGVVMLLLTSGLLFELCRRQFARTWGQTQEEIERQIQREEAV
ncbi:MAG: branched-chain amino acid ABC transporter permease [Betaproteobacteria bacterium]|nr:branched-chain amino acid ABC transporter permease [Betaproteobacteria bacterium]